MNDLCSLVFWARSPVLWVLPLLWTEFALPVKLGMGQYAGSEHCMLLFVHLSLWSLSQDTSADQTRNSGESFRPDYKLGSLRMWQREAGSLNKAQLRENTALLTSVWCMTIIFFVSQCICVCVWHYLSWLIDTILICEYLHSCFRFGKEICLHSVELKGRIRIFFDSDDKITWNLAKIINDKRNSLKTLMFPSPTARWLELFSVLCNGLEWIPNPSLRVAGYLKAWKPDPNGGCDCLKVPFRWNLGFHPLWRFSTVPELSESDAVPSLSA